jgi:mannose-1-phosphate guanylyltransferase
MDYAVVMAGGTGKRLWPLSRKNRPKQVLNIIDGQCLIRKAFDRLSPIFDIRNIIILTNAAYVDIVRENLPELPPENVIAEPAVRDTAAAIGLAAAILAKVDSNATMAVVTADQVIEPKSVFQQVIKDALHFINNNPDNIITFGIKPTFPSTQLGYINADKGQKVTGCINEIHPVKQFEEKPDLETAKKYISSGTYFWNAGMFVWKAKTILKHLHNFLPESIEPLTKISAAWDTHDQNIVLAEWFPKMPKISIDFAVMEKAPNIFAIKLDCRWLDMGSFNALSDIIDPDRENNTIAAKLSQLLDCKNSIIITEDNNHLIAAIGIEDIIIAHSPDATLVCTKEKAEQLKLLLENIEQDKGKKFL